MKADGKTKRHHDLALSGYGESMRESASQKKGSARTWWGRDARGYDVIWNSVIHNRHQYSQLLMK